MQFEPLSILLLASPALAGEEAPVRPVEHPWLDVQAGIKNPMGSMGTGGLFDVGLAFGVPRWVLSPTFGASLAWSGFSGHLVREREEYWDIHGWPEVESTWSYTATELRIRPGLRYLGRSWAVAATVDGVWLDPYYRSHTDFVDDGTGDVESDGEARWVFPGAVSGRLVTNRLLLEGTWGLVPEGTSRLLAGFRSVVKGREPGAINHTALRVKLETLYLNQSAMGFGEDAPGVHSTFSDLDIYLPYLYLGRNGLYFQGVDLPDEPDYNWRTVYYRVGPALDRCILVGSSGSGEVVQARAVRYDDLLCSLGLVGARTTDGLAPVVGFFSTGPLPASGRLDDWGWTQSTWEAIVAPGSPFYFHFRFNLRFF